VVTPLEPDSPSPRLRCATVLRVTEQSAEVVAAGEIRVVGFAASFPSPRRERLSPGHLVALTGWSTGTESVIVWRWYDAVVLGAEAGGVRMWEPAHGEVLATRRRDRPGPEPTDSTAPRGERVLDPGTRAYLSAGLAGAEWWVAGPVVADARDARVELEEVERFGAEHGLW
jgi:hypothetical protein